MFILGVDTSSRIASAALLADESLLSQKNMALAVSHSESLIGLLKEIVQDGGIDFHQLDLFAVACGPGSFTGLRVGLGTIMGLAWSLEKPVAAIPSLDILEACARPDAESKDIFAVLDAHRGDVYFRDYRIRTPYGEADTPKERILPAIEVPGMATGPTLFIGDGLERWRDTWSVALGSQFHEANAEMSDRRGEMTARLGYQSFLKGNTKAAAELRPRYVRMAAPEERRSGRLTI